MQDEQAALSSCCQRSLLSLADVDAHVTGLISSLIGYSDDTSTGGKPSLADLKAWMRTYFVAKEEMETQVQRLTLALEKKLSDASARTSPAHGEDWP